MSQLTLPALSGSNTLSELLYDALEDAIISGKLEPGSRLNPDDLARHFGVSRIPVRESLRALDANGWIELKPRHGAYVRQRTDAELRELFEVRLLLEEQAARLAAERRTSEQLSVLEKVVEDGRRAAEAGDDDEVTRINSVFHQSVVACADNDVLAQLLEGLSKRVRFYFTAATHIRGREAVEEHAALVKALRERGYDEAARIISQHIKSTRSAVAAQLDLQPA